MWRTLAELIVGPAISKALDAFKAAQGRGLGEAEARMEAEKAAIIAAETALKTELEERRDVLVAELRGESAIQRYWRPVVALTAFFSYWFVIIAYPFLLAWGLLPQVRFGETGLQNMFWLTTVAVGGYIGGRTVEKMMRMRGAR